MALAGCNGSHQVLGPGEDLFHGLQGGVIAEQRPPPPGADAPYPNIGSVPARPAAPDVAGQQRIADQLAAQRDEAEASAAASPLTSLPGPSSAPKPPTAPATPDPNANRVLVDAAATPPAPPAKPPAPASNAAAQPAGPVPDIGAVPAVPADVTSGPIPSLAPNPPPLPSSVGLDIPVSPPPSPAFTLQAAPKAPPNTVLIAFTPGSATLPPSATLNLRRFALAHRGAALTVTGHGADVLPGPDPQARALDLALRRAQAIAASLATAGVQAASLHLRADAAGQGGSASL